MQDAFFNRLVDDRLGGLQIGGNGFAGIARNGLADFLDNGLDTAFDRPVAQTATLILTGAFEC